MIPDPLSAFNTLFFAQTFRDRGPDIKAAFDQAWGIKELQWSWSQWKPASQNSPPDGVVPLLYKDGCTCLRQLSKIQDIVAGAPQGRVLRSTVFSCFLNYLLSFIRSNEWVFMSKWVLGGQHGLSRSKGPVPHCISPWLKYCAIFSSICSSSW